MLFLLHSNITKTLKRQERTKNWKDSYAPKLFSKTAEIIHFYVSIEIENYGKLGWIDITERVLIASFKLLSPGLGWPENPML